MRGFSRNNNNKLPFLRLNQNEIIYDPYCKANKLNEWYCNKTKVNKTDNEQIIQQLDLSNIPDVPETINPHNDISNPLFTICIMMNLTCNKIKMLMMI